MYYSMSEVVRENDKSKSLKCFAMNRKVAYDVMHSAQKKWLTKSCNLCWRGIGQTPTFGVILKTN